MTNDQALAHLRKNAPADSEIGQFLRATTHSTTADPLDVLAAIAALRPRLAEHEDHAVLKARRTGWAWSAIGDLLGMTRQNAQQRWGRVSDFLDSGALSAGREGPSI